MQLRYFNKDKLRPPWPFKVHIFWEGHIILQNIFDCMYCSQKLGEDFATFCDLLRIYELYLAHRIQQPRTTTATKATKAWAIQKSCSSHAFTNSQSRIRTTYLKKIGKFRNSWLWFSFSSLNTQFYDSRIFCLFTFWVFFPNKSNKLISKYIQKCQYNSLY